MMKRRIWKWLGYASTAILLFGAVAPQTLNIPLQWRPWVFLVSILWIFLFSTGSFS
jgi:hypothetical protein